MSSTERHGPSSSTPPVARGDREHREWGGLHPLLGHTWVSLRRSRVVADGPILPPIVSWGTCPLNRSGDRWHPNHCAELVSRVRDWEWLAWHFEA